MFWPACTRGSLSFWPGVSAGEFARVCSSRRKLKNRYFVTSSEYQTPGPELPAARVRDYDELRTIDGACRECNTPMHVAHCVTAGADFNDEINREPKMSMSHTAGDPALASTTTGGKSGVRLSPTTSQRRRLGGATGRQPSGVNRENAAGKPAGLRGRDDRESRAESESP